LKTYHELNYRDECSQAVENVLIRSHRPLQVICQHVNSIVVTKSQTNSLGHSTQMVISRCKTDT